MKDIKYPEEIKREARERALHALLYNLDSIAPKELLRPENIHRNDTRES